MLTLLRAAKAWKRGRARLYALLSRTYYNAIFRGRAISKKLDASLKNEWYSGRNWRRSIETNGGVG